MKMRKPRPVVPLPREVTSWEMSSPSLFLRLPVVVGLDPPNESHRLSTLSGSTLATLSTILLRARNDCRAEDFISSERDSLA